MNKFSVSIGSCNVLHARGGENDDPRYPHDEETAVDSIETLAEFDIERALIYQDGFVEHDSAAIGQIVAGIAN